MSTSSESGNRKVDANSTTERPTMPDVPVDERSERRFEYVRQKQRAEEAPNGALADALEGINAGGLTDGEVATVLEAARRLRTALDADRGGQGE